MGSFLFISNQMSKIGYPLCYNFAQMIDSKKPLIVSEVIDGSGDNTLSEKIQSYLPLVLLIFICCKLFNIYDYILNEFGLRTLNYNNDETLETVKTGRIIMQKSK